MKQSEIKRIAKYGHAVNITEWSFEEINILHKSHNLKKEAVSTGIYGMNGALFSDENGTLYAITARTSALFQLV